MQEIKLNKGTLNLPTCWEDLSFKQKIFTFKTLRRVLQGDLMSKPHEGLLELLFYYTAYRPSPKLLSRCFRSIGQYLRLKLAYIRNLPYMYKYGRKEFKAYMRLLKDSLTGVNVYATQRETINFNLLRLAEKITFVFTIDRETYKIVPKYNFTSNPIPYVKIGGQKYFGRRFELDITAKTDITAREFVDCFDLLMAIDKFDHSEQKQECVNQLCAILYPAYDNHKQNLVSAHPRAMQKLPPVIKYGIVYWFTSIVRFYTNHPVYCVLFEGSTASEDREDKIHIGMSEVALFLQKEGYGIPDTMNLNDYFAAQIKSLKDSINKALGEGMKADKLAQKTGISLTTINRLS